jgi:hypothetical protein
MATRKWTGTTTPAQKLIEAGEVRVGKAVAVVDAVEKGSGGVVRFPSRGLESSRGFTGSSSNVHHRPTDSDI